MTPTKAQILPFGPVPSEKQQRWHDLELYAFVHFTVNTFTGLEWGEGTESPAIFNPTDLDCRQWAQALKDGGFGGMILTTKHHDGFCLWPTKNTEHCIRNSPYQNGTGDIVREAADACAEYGLKFGVYLSPWDRNVACYGSGDAYNDYYCKQLEELLTGYGSLFEIWFDGACGEGPNGKKQIYDWDRFRALIRKHQPNAVIFGDGGMDIRWVGNENGYAGETNWCTIRENEFLPGAGEDIAFELCNGHGDGTSWNPPECDVSIRPGWFYHAEEDKAVKPTSALMDIYRASVGRNACLHLNIPPDARGRFHETDVQRLLDFRKERERLFSDDVAPSASTAEASSVFSDDDGVAPARIIDGNADSFWAAGDSDAKPWVQLDFPDSVSFSHVMLQEPIHLGQRIEAFVVEAKTESGWIELARGTTIGHKRILKTRPVTASSVRIRILSAKACPLLSRLALFREAVSTT